MIPVYLINIPYLISSYFLSAECSYRECSSIHNVPFLASPQIYGVYISEPGNLLETTLQWPFVFRMNASNIPEHVWSPDNGKCIILCTTPEVFGI